MDSLVSIVCVTHDRRELLLRCLESCVRQDYPSIEIVVLFNSSDPETEKIIRDKYPPIKVLRSHRNIGAFPAVNLAIANSNGEFILTVDDDAYFLSNDVVRKMKRAFDEEPELGAATCNIEGPNEKTLTGKNRYVHEFKSGFTMIPKRIFTELVGYYPDLFFRSAGEYYISSALWDHGMRTKCLVDARMYHEQSIQGRSDYDWKYYGLRSQVLCVLMREPLAIIPLSLASKFVKSFIYFIRWGHLHTWIRAWWGSLIHSATVLHNRKPISWNTYKLLRKLRYEYISDAKDLS